LEKGGGAQPCGHFSDIGFVFAGYAPRAKGATFAGCLLGAGAILTESAAPLPMRTLI